MKFKADQIIAGREHRDSRLGNAFRTFDRSFREVMDASAYLASTSHPEPITHLIEKSIVISCVTSIETYYRDMLHLMFKYCSPEFFRPKLKLIYPEKFDIDELVDVYQHNLHPLEIVLSSQSFQNISKIERVFSKFLNTGFWPRLVGLQMRIKDKPDSGVQIQQSHIDSLSDLFTLRHELVHEPGRKNFIDSGLIDKLYDSWLVIFASDMVLSQLIEDHRDPLIASFSKH